MPYAEDIVDVSTTMGDMGKEGVIGLEEFRLFPHKYLGDDGPKRWSDWATYVYRKAIYQLVEQADIGGEAEFEEEDGIINEISSDRCFSFKGYMGE